MGDNCLIITYSGFVPYDRETDKSSFYLLKLNGGENGIINENGSFMTSDVEVLLRTK